jgi:ABC-2 type transport system ATP-binding protein
MSDETATVTPPSSTTMLVERDTGDESRGTELAIETKGLTKRLGHAAVVDNLDLAVPRGSVYGFLGPNGSGKTTTIRMLLGLIWPTAGSYRLLGQSMPAGNARVLPQVGALVEGPAFYPWLTGRQNLRRIDAAGPDGQRSTRADRIDTALARVGLAAAATKRYRAYSLGMKQRLGLAAALLRPRSLLILDEPTNGMDPQGTREIRNLVRELAAEGSTVFLSSHLLSEVEQLCTHLGIISVGKMVAQGSIEDLRGRGEAMLRVETDDAANAAQVLQQLGLESIIVTGAVVSAQLDGQRPEECNRALVLAGVGVRSLTTDRRSLEDAFVALTGEGFDVAG